MSNKDYILMRLKNNLEADKLMNIDSLKMLLANDIMKAVSNYLEINLVDSEVVVSVNNGNVVVKANIISNAIKKLGANIL